MSMAVACSGKAKYKRNVHGVFGGAVFQNSFFKLSEGFGGESGDDLRLSGGLFARLSKGLSAGLFWYHLGDDLGR